MANKKLMADGQWSCEMANEKLISFSQWEADDAKMANEKQCHLRGCRMAQWEAYDRWPMISRCQMANEAAYVE